MLNPFRHARAIRVARVIAGLAFGLEALAIAGLLLDWRAVVIGTLACAGLASAAFYGAYEGFDEVLRRPK